MCNTPRPPGRRQERHRNDLNRLEGIYGDHIKQKRKGMIRLLFQNPQGLGPISNLRACQSSKLNTLKDTLIKHNIDVLGLAEVNKDWRLVPHQETLWSATEGWFEYRRLAKSNNTAVPPTSKIQFGGTLLLETNRVAYSIGIIEEDPRRLGRWTSIVLQGKDNHRSRIICAYCPCLSNGTSSTYALQTVALTQQKKYECPRKQFWIDLKEFIRQCQDKKEHIVIMGDWNSDYQEVTHWMSEFGLQDIIQQRHYLDTPPPTCQRSRDSPIDAIFGPEHFTCWRGGYLTFDYLEGDHRGIWCDIPIEFLLGYNMPNPIHPGARRLKNDDPRIRKKYLSHLHTLLKTDDIYSKMTNLYKGAQKRWLPSDIFHFEEIDDSITSAMMTAEQRCRKLNMGMIKWSPHYQRACDKVTYWQLVKKQLEGRHINTRKIISLKKKLRLSGRVDNIVDANTQLSKAITERKKCKKYAAELQMEYRHRLAQDKEEEDNLPAATHIRNLTKQEDTRILFRRLRYLEKKMINLTTSRLTVSMPNGQEKEITKKEQIEYYIMQTNEQKYHQTEGHGQLQKGQLLTEVGTTGTGPKSVQILDGSYKPPAGTNFATQQFLKAMKKPTNYSQLHHITFHEFCEGWKKAKERTSSNGPHFGHYKAGVLHPKIGPLLYHRSQIPLLTGYSPRRHREGVDVMLLKKEKNYNVNNLRTIVLFDSEANMNYKHLGRRAMSAAIAKNQIATEQYSRPNRKSIDHAMNRRLVMDHQLYKRQPYAMTSCDLKSCYDRINHSSASLALQRIGTSPQEVNSMLHTIQQMSHKVRTAYGESTTSYGGNPIQRRWKLPPQGVLQGNGSGPSIWSILSSMLFHILRDTGHRNSFTSSIRKYCVELAGFAYVDDTDLIQVNNCINVVVRKMQSTVHLWNELVSVTGGILAPEKCWWYLVAFKYLSGKWTACNPNAQHKVWMKDAKKQRREIERIPVSTGINMLGVHIAPDGNNKDHIIYLRKKAEKWAGNIQDCRSNQTEIWTALHRTIPLALGYSLPATTMTKEECRYIIAPVYKYGLSRAGIPHTIPTAIRYGPYTMGGLGLTDPYVQMGVRKLESFITNTWQKTPTGTLMEIAIDDLMLEIGMQSPFTSLRLLKKGLEYITTISWIRSMCTFMLEHDILVEMDDIRFKPQRLNDTTIMEKAITMTGHIPTLKSINKVRMKLNVLWLSDIITADGQKIDIRFLKDGPQIPRNHHHWPLQHNTTTLDWQRWTRWIKDLRAVTTSWTLTEILGPWTVPQEQWISTWDCLVTKNREILYIRSADGVTWERHIKQQVRNRRVPRYHREFLIYREIPDQVHGLDRATYLSTPTHLELACTSEEVQWDYGHSQAFDYTYFHPTKDNIIAKLRTILHPDFLSTTQSIEILLRDFSNGSTVSVSDGSYYPESGKAAGAWVIESSCRSQWIMVACTVPGSKECFTSYRSELFGLFGISVTLRVLAMCSPPPTHCIVGCDGEAALLSLNESTSAISANTKDADIISCINAIWNSFGTRPVPVHIDGHQDNFQKTLNRLEKMNVLMNKLATLVAANCSSRSPHWRLPGTGIRTLHYGNRMVTGQLNKFLYEAINANVLWTYLHQRLVGEKVQKDQIHWKAMEYARKRATTGLNIFMSKWISNTVLTGQVMQRRRQRVFNRCPRCNSWGEDREHIIRCWDVRANIIWKAGLSKLQHTLIKEDTHQDIAQFIIEGLGKFKRSKNPHQQVSDTVWKAEQQEIGWMNFLAGFLSTKMVEKQQQYYRSKGSRKGGHTWAGKIILQGWHIIQTLWLGRNEVLHKKKKISEISGEVLLDIEIEIEYDKGHEGIPLIYHKWWTKQTKEELLESSVVNKKGWLLIVKTLKESLQIAEYSIFTSSRALQKWIGLDRG